MLLNKIKEQVVAAKAEGVDAIKINQEYVNLRKEANEISEILLASGNRVYANQLATALSELKAVLIELDIVKIK